MHAANPYFVGGVRYFDDAVDELEQIRCIRVLARQRLVSLQWHDE